MAYSEDKIRLTVAVDEDLNEKLEVFSEAMCISKTNLIINLLNDYLYDYSVVWNSINTVDKINVYINGMRKCNKDVSELLKIKKVLLTNPRLVNRANTLMRKLAEESKNKKKKK